MNAGTSSVKFGGYLLEVHRLLLQVFRVLTEEVGELRQPPLKWGPEFHIFDLAVRFASTSSHFRSAMRMGHCETHARMQQHVRGERA